MNNYGHLHVEFDDGSVGWYEAGWGPMMSEVAFFVKDVVGPKGCASIVTAEQGKGAGEGASDTTSADIDTHTKAEIWFDRRMGPVIGTDRRVAKANFRALDDSHNYDCWDTTRNTLSLLLVLQEWGLLKYHVVGNPHYRGNVLVLQTMHNTAVLVERATKVEWVLDVWPRGYAQPPDVMTVEKWVTEY